MLEVEFLFLIDFNLYVSTEEYAKIYRGKTFNITWHSIITHPFVYDAELVTSNPLLMKLFSPQSPPSAKPKATVELPM